MTIEQKIQYLTKKPNNPKARYTDEELSWLINHIGDPDAKIRDELVCNTFGSGFFEEKFTREQVRFLFENVQKRNLLFYNISKNISYSSLTRSFTCLLLELLIQTNGNQASKYFQILSLSEEQFIFKGLIKYLEEEHDYSGYDEKYGWIHAIAHCSDALEVSVVQTSFNLDLINELLSATHKLFCQINKKFIDEEEYHLADVFIAGLQNNKLSSTNLIKWFNSFNFNPESSSQIEFHRFGNLKSFAEDIYVKLNTANLLDSDLKKYIEKEFSQMY